MQCGLCDSTTTMVLDLGRQPLANKYPATEADFEKEEFFPLQVFFCAECKNVQLGTVVSRARMFEDYYYLSSVNQGLVRHFEQLAHTLAKARFVVDIGSNDGILLKPLKELGVRALGVDPSVNVGKMANDAGLETLVSFFDAKTAELIQKQYGKPDVVVASSVFTHLQDPHQFIEDVKSLMIEDGAFIVEVEYVGTIVQNLQFERFYLDRIFYYSLSSLGRLFAAHGMHIADAAMIEPHGGSIRITVRRSERGSQPSEEVKRILAEEGKNLNLAAFQTFRHNVEGAVGAFREALAQYKNSGLKIAGYGAPARVATICNYADVGPAQIPYIVDDSLLKQGRFTPGTHIPIVPADFLEANKPDILVVFAYEYLDDIRKKTNNRYRYVIPIPPREIS